MNPPKVDLPFLSARERSHDQRQEKHRPEERFQRVDDPGNDSATTGDSIAVADLYALHIV